MAKDPAFLFYPGDFNTGTQFFTDEQVGKYMRLLMAQHQHGHLSEEQVLHICKTYDNHIMNKFIKDSNGLWYNQRLENEIIKRKEYSKSRSNNRNSKKLICKSYVNHMENKNRNENIDVINNESESQILGTGEKYFLVVPKTLGSIKYRIQGTDGLKHYMEIHQSILDHPDQHQRFMREVNGDVFNDLMHVRNRFKKFIEKQYA